METKRLFWRWARVLALLAVVILFGSTCSDGPFNETIGDDDYEIAVVDSLMGVLTNALNEVEHVTSELTFEAGATACPASPGACSGSTRTVLYDTDGDGSGSDSCKRQGGTLFGSVTLTFSETGCSNFSSGIPGTGNVFITTANFKRVNSQGGVVATNSSSSHQNYAGETIGGGALGSGVRVRFEEEGTQKSIHILGARRLYTDEDGESGFDHSVTTLHDSGQEFGVTGMLQTANRGITRGEAEISLNNVQAKARVSISTSDSSSEGLVWGFSECCYPSSGQLDMTFTGSVTGSVSILFRGLCGRALLTQRDGDTREVELRACE